MRLFAFGGTSYNERCRLGVWPDLLVGALQDVYGLTEDRISYGLGTLGQQPFLLLRRHQDRQLRGGYPLTVLVDPGEGVWQRFGWNAARLIACLMDGEGAPGAALMAEPERFASTAALQALFDAVRPPRSPGPRDLPPDVCAVWLAPLFSEETVVVRSARLGFDRMPEPAMLASVLDSLPIALRLGRGWLVGGGRNHGTVYGSALVVDEGAMEDLATPGAFERGRRLWEAITVPAGVPAEVLDEVLALPVWRWDPGPGELLRQLELARELDSPGKVETKDWAWVMGGGGRGAIGACLRRKASDALVGRGAPLSAEETSALLSLHEADGASLEGALAGQLHERTVLDWLASRGVPPAAFPGGLAVPAHIRRVAWEAYLDRIETGWPAALEQGLQDLTGQADAQEIEVLAQKAVLNSLATKGGGFELWLPLCKDVRWGPVVQGVLRRRVRAHARNRGPDWIRHYLALGGDPGGAWLSQDPTGAVLGDEMVRGLLTLRDEEMLIEAESWLRGLAGSPLRRALRTDLKLQVADRVGREWESLRVLRSLVLGEPGPGPERSPAEQRDALLQESVDLIEMRTPQSPPPDVEGIAAFFGDKVPAEIRKQLVNTPTAFADDGHKRRYLEEVSQHLGVAGRKIAERGIRQDQEERLDHVIDALAKNAESKDPGEVQRILASLPGDERLELLAAVLHGRLAEGEDETRRPRALRAWVRAARTEPALGGFIASALEQGPRSDDSRKRLVRRHFVERELLADLLSVLPREGAEKAMEIYADGYEQEFVQEAIRRLKPYRGGLKFLRRPGPVETAMALYLRDHVSSSAGRKVHRALMEERDVATFESFMGAIFEKGRGD